MRRVVITLLLMTTMLLGLAQSDPVVVTRVERLMTQCQAYIRDINVEMALHCATEARRELDKAGLSRHPLYAEALLCQAQLMTDRNQTVPMLRQCLDIIHDMTDIDKSIDYELQLARIWGSGPEATDDDYREALNVILEALHVLEVLSSSGHTDLADKYTIPLLLQAEEITFNSGDYAGAQELLNMALDKGARPSSTGATYEDSHMWQLLLAYQLELVDAQDTHPGDLDDMCRAYYFMLTQDAAYQFGLLPQDRYTGYALRSSANFNFLHHLCIKYRQDQPLQNLAYDVSLFSRALTRRMNHWQKYYDMTPDSLHKEQTIAYLLRQANRWESVQRDLRPGEAAIEFVSGYVISHGRYHSDKSYAAIVLRHDGHPTIVPLSGEKEMLQILQNSTDAATVQQQTYQALWAPIEAHLQGISRIYYAPSGPLSAIPLGALCDGRGGHLCDHYDLQLLSTTGAGVLSYLKRWKRPKTALLVGDIAYGGKPGNGNYRDALRGNVAPLDNSQAEITSIEQHLKRKHTKTQMLGGVAATESNIKRLDKKCPELLHIVTHGFYIRSDKQAEYRGAIKALGVKQFHESTAMERCGLLMAGANRAWTTGEVTAGQDDGILTGDEIAALDLSGCRLVVLSACETGLGDMTDYEGVMGLQRAFKLAGAQTIVMSLWKVRDDVTALLMTRFYDHLMSGRTPHEAMREAQREVRRDHPDPRDWAAFVVLD